MLISNRDRVSDYFSFKYLKVTIMSTDITVPNGAASPVNKTFTVARSAAGDESAVLFLREGVNLDAFPKLEFSTRAASNGGKRGRRGATTLVVPYGTTVGDVFTKAGEISLSVVANVPNDAPDAIRADAAAFLPGILANAQLKDIIKKGYAT